VVGGAVAVCLIDACSLYRSLFAPTTTTTTTTTTHTCSAMDGWVMALVNQHQPTPPPPQDTHTHPKTTPPPPPPTPGGKKTAAADAHGGGGSGKGGASAGATGGVDEDPHAALYAIPEIASLGRAFRSTAPPVALTESETEYVVTCVKHVFEAPYVVLQFDVVNTIPEQKLLDVRVRVDGAGQVGLGVWGVWGWVVFCVCVCVWGGGLYMDGSYSPSFDNAPPANQVACVLPPTHQSTNQPKRPHQYTNTQELYTVAKTLPCPSLAYGAQGGKTYVVLQRHSEAVTAETLQCQLLFNVVDVDPATGEVRVVWNYVLFLSLSLCGCVGVRGWVFLWGVGGCWRVSFLSHVHTPTHTDPHPTPSTCPPPHSHTHIYIG
jgi:hypothetical protein